MNALLKYGLLSILLFYSSYSFSQDFSDHDYPFSTTEEHLSIWNGNEYIPFFVKGVNLGISVPGTFPGELAATRAQYGRWLQQIKDAGFNTIRLYTLHYPRFYEVLDSFNIANPQNPIFIFQGVWLNEEIEDYNLDLNMLNTQFTNEIQENIDCIHGNIIIPHRYGKAYGDFHTDVSKWNMAYIIGREVGPYEIMTTNQNHLNLTSYVGTHLAISGASASEVWYTEKMDYVLEYEQNNYQTQRPVSFSSWPTLDPLEHVEEAFNDEDTASIDLSKLQLRNAPAGIFVSYHAYPYYPDFVSEQTSYQSYYDNYGPNSYLGYLTELKSHYEGIPLIIAEFGVPSSWGVAHYASSGMNHGGFDEESQGETDIRILKSIEATGCGGGFQFAWMDEWFKRTWVTDHIDFPGDRRIQWHNITAAEQNFGLLSFTKESVFEEVGNFGQDSKIQSIKVGSNYTFLEIEISLKDELDVPDEMWVALDTYLDALGESILPNGQQLAHRSEFALEIKNYSANLYVTEAYDLYGIYHWESSPNQLYHSTVTDGAPWKIVRWKNNAGPTDVQYIGSLQLNHATQAPNSKDAVTIYDDKIKIRIPWTLINVIAPSELKVFHDDRSTPETEEMITDGIAVSVSYQGQLYSASQRYLWDAWNALDVRQDSDLQETFKTSYWAMKDRLNEFNSKAMAIHDSIYLSGPDFPITVGAEIGVLMNDFDLDGNELMALVSEAPLHGSVQLDIDGSFTYMPEIGFNGIDVFKYTIFDGYSLSEPNSVFLRVNGNVSDIGESLISMDEKIELYPNPVKDFLNIQAEDQITEIRLFDLNGKYLDVFKPQSTLSQIDFGDYPRGEYFLLINMGDQLVSKKVVLQ